MWILQFVLFSLLFVLLFTGTGLMVVTLFKAIRSGDVKRLREDVRNG